MDELKILSGDVIVAKGVTKQSVTLPEVGLKSVIPDGSWLELKQIQTALEARKHILDVERIEKSGAVSHAIWRDDLQLAEVTQKVGGCWHYFGHNVGKTLYLRPEEVLFLMEVNCLLLKHNDITVSLQKAYSLVLNDNLSFNQYRVYASLSRIGYKVYRHKVLQVNKDKITHSKKVNQMSTSESLDKDITDTTAVENILKQPVADASIEVIDSKTNDSRFNVHEQSPITELNNSADESNIRDQEIQTTEEKSGENKKQSDTSKNVKESACVMEVQENGSDGSNISDHKMHGNNNISERLINTVNNVDANHTSAQTSVAHNNETENTESNNNQCDEVMEVDNVVPMQSNKENQDELASTAPLIERQSEIFQNIDTPDVKACEEEDNVNSTKITHYQNRTTPTAMDISDECCQVAAISSPPKGRNLTDDNIVTEVGNSSKSSICFSDALISNRNQTFQNYVLKLKTLTSRQSKPSDSKTLNKYFENVPDLFKKEVVTINAPEQEYIPKNIFVNNTSYVLNIKQIRKCDKSTSVDSIAYNSLDEVNGNHVRRLRSISTTDSQNTQFGNYTRFPTRNQYYRPYTIWRPNNNLNYVQFNMFFPRPSFSNVYFHSRLQYQPRPNPLLRGFSYNNPNNTILTANQNQNANNNPRKRMRSAKATHLQSIKSLAVRLKHLIMQGGNHIQNIESLHRLLYAYNTKFKARLRLTKDFEVINDETIVETIDLGDDDETKNKRPRLSQDSDKFNENLNLLRQLALRMKDLEAEGNATSKHKRALSKAIKTFNKSYDADIYMNTNFEVIDKRFINIESDSESDCVVAETQKVYKGKKLRNPFNILKRRSEQVEPNASTSKETTDKESDINNLISTDGTANGQNLSKIFNENWLPRENDFGRAEVVHKNDMNSRFEDIIKEEYLLNFVKSHFEEFNNWLEAKIAFLQHMEETDVAYQNEHERQLQAIKEPITHSDLKPLLDSEDCLDTGSVLEKLRIVKNNKEIPIETKLSVDFDVYHREITNFKKTNPPKPHFRLICIDESSSFPSSAEVVSIISKYPDKIPIVFAIVGISSVSFLQLKPIDLPVYVASNDSD